MIHPTAAYCLALAVVSSLDYLKARQSSTAVPHGTCADSTFIPYLANHLRLGNGCYGCRDVADLGGNETVPGFPNSILTSIADQLEFLAGKAIPITRSIKGWAGLRDQRREKVHA